MSQLKLSPTALKAFLACPRRWYLEHVARAPRDVPSYITGGLNLDEAATRYLQGNNPHGQLSLDLDTEETKAELAVLKPLLPAPGKAQTQVTLSAPLPDVPGVLVHGKLDALALSFPFLPNHAMIYDVKRVWAREAMHSAFTLAKDEQMLIYAWLVRYHYPTADVHARWAYAVRGKRPVGIPIDVVADFAAIAAWFDDVVKPAARAMLALREERVANDIAHNPDSCNMGARCFVARSCSLFTGPMGKGEDMALKFKKTAVNPPEVIETTGVGVYEPTQTIEPPKESESATTVLAVSAPAEPSPAPALSSSAGSGADPLEIAARVRTALLALDLPKGCGLSFSLDYAGARLWVTITEDPA